MKTIAFFGPQQSGKSTAAEAIGALEGWVKLSFADPIYRMMSALLDADARQFRKTEPLPQLCGKTLREALQSLGTEWGRGMIGETLWTDTLKERIRQIHMKGQNVVIDDMRFLNEYEMLKGIGAITIKVSRYSDRGVETHASEADWPKFEPQYKFENKYPVVNPWQAQVREFARKLVRGEA